MTLCITTVVDKKYHEYIPIFIYCATRSWPEADVKVFSTDAIDLDIFDQVDQSKPSTVIERTRAVTMPTLNGYDKTVYRLPAYLRYLLFTSERIRAGVWNYDHVYITDGDMLMTPQKPGLVQQHRRHMKRTGMCYSNVVRGYRPFVMTGLHFVTAEYIRHVAPTVDKYDALFREKGEGVLDAPAKIKDERLLYQIVRDSGLPMAPIWNHMIAQEYDAEDPANCDRKLFRPWHGLNIGRARGPNWASMPFGRARDRYSQNAVLELWKFAQDPLFKECYSFLSDESRQAVRRMVTATCAELQGAFI